MAIAGSHSSTHRAPLAPFVILAVLVAAVFAQWIPHNLQSFLRYDSGIFLYVGEQLRHGSALYRDVWDHKPPLIFYFNELGLAVANGSAAGVFVLAYLFVAAFFLLVYRETARLFENGVALLSTCLGVLLFMDVVLHPNLGEVISLPLQAISFALLVRDVETGFSLGRAAAQGFLLAALFWIRPNGIAISIVYAAFTALSLVRKRNSARTIQWASIFIGGAAISSLVLIAPTLRASSWHDLWFATFTFNQLYAGLTTLGDRAHALIWMIILAAQHGVMLLALAGVISILLVKSDYETNSGMLRKITVLWLALEMILSAYTGKLYGKNIVPWTLPCVLSIAFVIEQLRPDYGRKGIQLGAFSPFTALVAAFVMFTAFTQYRENAKESEDADALLLSKVKELALPPAKVIFWGSFTMDTIYRAHCQSPSRFFSSVPLMHGEPAYRRLAPLELTDILRNEPKLIVERNDGQIPPLKLAEAEQVMHLDWDTEELKQQKSELMKKYEAVWMDEARQITIFRLR